MSEKGNVKENKKVTPSKVKIEDVKKQLTPEEIKEQHISKLRDACHAMYPQLKDYKVLNQLTGYTMEAPDGKRFVVHNYIGIDMDKVTLRDVLAMMEEIKFNETNNIIANSVTANLQYMLEQQAEQAKLAEEAQQVPTEEVEEDVEPVN